MIDCYRIPSVLILAGAALGGCATTGQKVADDRNNVAEAKKKLDDARAEYLADVEKCRKETAEKVAANQRSIAEFRAPEFGPARW